MHSPPRRVSACRGVSAGFTLLQLAEHFQATFPAVSLAAALTFCPTPLLTLVFPLSCISACTLACCSSLPQTVSGGGKRSKADRDHLKPRFTRQTLRGGDWQKARQTRPSTTCQRQEIWVLCCLGLYNTFKSIKRLRLSGFCSSRRCTHFLANKRARRAKKDELELSGSEANLCFTVHPKLFSCSLHLVDEMRWNREGLLLYFLKIMLILALNNFPLNQQPVM